MFKSIRRSYLYVLSSGMACLLFFGLSAVSNAEVAMSLSEYLDRVANNDRLESPSASISGTAPATSAAAHPASGQQKLDPKSIAKLKMLIQQRPEIVKSMSPDKKKLLMGLKIIDKNGKVIGSSSGTSKKTKSSSSKKSSSKSKTKTKTTSVPSKTAVASKSVSTSTASTSTTPTSTTSTSTTPTSTTQGTADANASQNSSNQGLDSNSMKRFWDMMVDWADDVFSEED